MKTLTRHLGLLLLGSGILFCCVSCVSPFRDKADARLVRVVLYYSGMAFPDTYVIDITKAGELHIAWGQGEGGRENGLSAHCTDGAAWRKLYRSEMDIIRTLCGDLGRRPTTTCKSYAIDGWNSRILLGNARYECSARDMLDRSSGVPISAGDLIRVLIEEYSPIPMRLEPWGEIQWGNARGDDAVSTNARPQTGSATNETGARDAEAP